MRAEMMALIYLVAKTAQKAPWKMKIILSVAGFFVGLLLVNTVEFSPNLHCRYQECSRRSFSESGPSLRHKTAKAEQPKPI